MKKICLIVLFVFTCNVLLAQQQAPKLADKILVKNDKSASDNFLAVKLSFAEKGIEIVSQDADIKQFKTGLMPLLKSGAKIYYIVFCKDNTIQFTGFFNTGIEAPKSILIQDGDPFRPIVNRGMKGSYFAEAWKAMNILALTFGSDIQYLGGKEPKG